MNQLRRAATSKLSLSASSVGLAGYAWALDPIHTVPVASFMDPILPHASYQVIDHSHASLIEYIVNDQQLKTFLPT